MTTTREAALEAALKLARNRLQARAIDHPTGSREMAERSEWADEATAALSTPATEPPTLIDAEHSRMMRAARPTPQPAADTRVSKTLETCFDEIRAVVRAAEDEWARYGDIAATIRINALHHGATAAEAEAMVKGEINFISWVSAIVDKRTALRALAGKGE